MNLLNEFKKILNETKGQAEGSTIYLLIVVAIVAIVLLAVVKPMFKNSTKISAKKANLPNQSINNPPQ